MTFYGLLILITILCINLLIIAEPSIDPYRAIDGSGNNIEYSYIGQSGRFYSRLLPSATVVSTVNARNISNALFFSLQKLKNQYSINMGESLFTQFLNHDFEATLTIRSLNLRINTTVYPGDVIYNPNATIKQLLVAPSNGTISSETGEFEVYNNATSWCDLSNLYGSTDDVTLKIRSGINGTLKMSTYIINLGPVSIPVVNLLPNSAITGLTSQTVFSVLPSAIPTSGDERANENVGEFVYNTIMAREHNRINTKLQKSLGFRLFNATGPIVTAASYLNDTERDEMLFQESARRNRAIYQKIVFNDYPSVILGKKLPPYNGYRSDAAMDTSIEFASAAFRYGHSTIDMWHVRNATTGCIHNFTFRAGQTTVTTSQLSNGGQLGGPFTPAFALVTIGGMENLLRGLLNAPAAKMDLIYSEDVLRSVTFAGSSGLGVDVGVADLIRCRENKCPLYNEIRKKYYEGYGPKNIYASPLCHANRNTPAIDPLECFLLINSNLNIAMSLQEVYSKINKIEAIVGLFAENDEGTPILPTMSTIIRDFYINSRDGDRFYYENDQFDASELHHINSRSLSDVIADNTNLKNIQANAFLIPDESSIAPQCL